MSLDVITRTSDPIIEKTVGIIVCFDFFSHPQARLIFLLHLSILQLPFHCPPSNMRIANTSDMDNLPPPPYSEVASQPVQASLRGGYMRPSLPSEMPTNDDNFLSATTYFEIRDAPDLPEAGVGLSLVEHTIHFNAEITRDDLAFPVPIETYVARDVTSLDWSTFVDFLFPKHDEVRNGRLMPEKDPQRLSFVGQDTPARRDRILAVIAEWNENFFSPRRIHINANFSPLPSYPSSRSTALSSAAQDPYGGSRPFPTARPTMYDDAPAHRSGNLSALQPLHRSLSTSSSSSSSSSSCSSVDSIKSKDLEGADLGRVRSALLSFQLNATKDHLRASVRQLRDEIRAQRQNFSGKESKELKKELKSQKKEIKKEIRAVVKQARATRKAARKIRKAERKSQRKGKRADYRGNDRIRNAQDKGQRAEERAAERVLRAQERGKEIKGRMSEKAARVHERVREAEAAATQRAQNARTSATKAGTRETVERARYGADGEQETGVLLKEG